MVDADLLPETIQERRKLLQRTFSGMSDNEAEGWLKHFRRRFGKESYTTFTLDECAQAIHFLGNGKWPEGSLPTTPAKAQPAKVETVKPGPAAAGATKTAPTEDDPFDTSEPTLLDVPKATKGHES